MEALYRDRLAALGDIAACLESRIRSLLGDEPNIDRVEFRVKNVDSFVRKATRAEDPYEAPLREVEDQIGGRILTFFLSDVARVKEILRDNFQCVESRFKRPASAAAFDYESQHLICVIPIDLRPEAWSHVEDPPVTFEMQVRTLYMHAWAQCNHDIVYKAPIDVPLEVRRETAFAAASSWGADQCFERARAWRDARTT